MKKMTLSFLLFCSLFVLSYKTTAQNAPVNKPASQLSPEEIIKRFTQKESELFEAWKDYAYQQETKLQVIGQAKTISGEFYQLSEFVFSDAGKRIERILKAPPSTLDNAGLTMTQEDKNAFINLQPFALTAQELPNYQVKYIGKEKVDDLNTYVFEVTPKAILDSREMKRMKDQKIEGKYFQGRIWVDDLDLQIVKTAGKIVPEFGQRFLKFETYRENIDGKFWFPTYTYGDDDLVFERGNSIHVRNVVRYKNYRRFSGDVKFKEVLEVEPTEENPVKVPPTTATPPSTNSSPASSATAPPATQKTVPPATTKPTLKIPPKKP
jgi:hypothetical protein